MSLLMKVKKSWQTCQGQYKCHEDFESFAQDCLGFSKPFLKKIITMGWPPEAARPLEVSQLEAVLASFDVQVR
jgi:hypothetical protein